MCTVRNWFSRRAKQEYHRASSVLKCGWFYSVQIIFKKVRNSTRSLTAFSNALCPVTLVARFYLEWIVNEAKIFELAQFPDFRKLAPVLK